MKEYFGPKSKIDVTIKTFSELKVHFQPIFCSKSCKIYGFEALSRHPEDNVSIIELLEKARADGSIYFLDMICRRNAVQEAVKQGISNLLFVNICPDTIVQPYHEVGYTDKILEEFGFPKEMIVLEITENLLDENYQSLIQTMCHYKELGYKIALDDFGAGAGGLKLLSTTCIDVVKPDFVKIDKYFINSMTHNHFSYSFVEFVTKICHKFDIPVIAEGIERYEELSLCLQLGIDYLQGYYLGKPQAQVSSFISYDAA